MVEITAKYDGGLRCTATHGPSSSALVTDAPVDNHGKGESFSPTDLIATALATCVLTTMGILATKRGWNVDGMEVRVQKIMTQELPRRIAQLPVTLTIPDEVAGRLDLAARAELEASGNKCPVKLTLHPQIEAPITFVWGSRK
jgi:putative redox protein